MYQVAVSSKGSTSYTAKSQGHEFVIDSEEKEGIAPMSTLLASLGACIGVYIRKYAFGTKLPINDFEITLKADLCKERPVRFKSIAVTIDFKGLVLDEMRMNSLVEFIKNCPVHNTLESKPEIAIELK